MEEFIISDILGHLFPAFWPVVSYILFGKTVFCYVKDRYHDHGLYELDADDRISGISFLATIVFMLFASFDITGLAKIFANLMSDIPAFVFILSYILRWAIAYVIELVFCSVTWNLYLKNYIDRSIYL